MKALDELKHSIKLHLQLAGDVTKDLGEITLKLIDIIECDNEKLKIQELNYLSIYLIKRLCETLLKHLDKQYLNVRFNKGMTKQDYLYLLSDILRLMNSDFQVYDLEGNNL